MCGKKEKEKKKEKEQGAERPWKLMYGQIDVPSLDAEKRAVESSVH